MCHRQGEGSWLLLLGLILQRLPGPTPLSQQADVPTHGRRPTVGHRRRAAEGCSDGATHTNFHTNFHSEATQCTHTRAPSHRRISKVNFSKVFSCSFRLRHQLFNAVLPPSSPLCAGQAQRHHHQSAHCSTQLKLRATRRCRLSAIFRTRGPVFMESNGSALINATLVYEKRTSSLGV